MNYLNLLMNASRIFGVAGLLPLVSCSSPPSSQHIIHVPKPECKLGKPFKISSNVPWNPTGIQLEKGRSYCITSRVADGGIYSDGGIPCTPDGPKGAIGKAFDWAARDARCCVNPFRWIGPGKVKRLRILQDRGDESTPPRWASFLTLIAAMGKDDNEGNVYVIGSTRTIKPNRSGELVVFANDWPGGPGETGEARFFDTKGKMISKSYNNNSGSLEITVTDLSQPKHP